MIASLGLSRDLSIRMRARQLGLKDPLGGVLFDAWVDPAVGDGLLIDRLVRVMDMGMGHPSLRFVANKKRPFRGVGGKRYNWTESSLVRQEPFCFRRKTLRRKRMRRPTVQS